MPRMMKCRTSLGSLFAALALVVFAASGASAGPAFVYALNQVNGGPNLIYGFRINPSTGALTPISGSPFSSGGTGGAGAFSEHVAYVKGRLFVVNQGSSSLSVLAVNPNTGGLTALPFSPIALSGNLACVAVHPSGSPVAVGGNAGVASLAITATSATAAPGSPFPTIGTSPYSCAFSRDGDYFYTGGSVGASTAGFAVAPNGTLTAIAGSPFDSGAPNPVGYATDAAGRLFTSTIGAGAGLRVFTTTSGALTGAIDNPFASGLTEGIQGILHPSGFYLVADRGGNGLVGVYQIAGAGAATTLSAVAGSPFSTGGTSTVALALSPDGSFLLAANANSRNLTTFRVNTSTGGLLSLGIQASNTIGSTGRITGLAVASSAAPGDFDGDGRSDLTVFRPSFGFWVTLKSGTTMGATTAWGSSADKPVVGDFDGDEQGDIAIYRPSTGAWYVLPSSPTVVPYGFNWGNSADIPVPWDYDGDGKTDIAVFRPSTGTWFVVPSTSGVPYGVFWGNSADIPTPGDYDGDRKADIAVYRPSNGTWYVIPSTTGVPYPVNWGNSADKPVAADYDGDGKTDVAVFRPSNGTWYVIPSTTGVPYGTAWGNSADIPVPADFDGDAKTDVAVYRPSNGTWYVIPSSTGVPYPFMWGNSTDIPLFRRP